MKCSTCQTELPGNGPVTCDHCLRKILEQILTKKRRPALLCWDGPRDLALKEIDPYADSRGRWVPYWNYMWAQLRAIPKPEPDPIPPAATHISAHCNQATVHLKKEDDRWHIYTVSFPGKRLVRNRTFASPHRGHAQLTAIAWYGDLQGAWQVEALESIETLRIEEEPAMPIEEAPPGGDIKGRDHDH